MSTSLLSAPVSVVSVSMALRHLQTQRIASEVERIRLNAVIKRQAEQIALLRHKLSAAPTDSKLSALQQHCDGAFADACCDEVDVQWSKDGPMVDQESVIVDIEDEGLVLESFYATKRDYAENGEPGGEVRLRFTRGQVMYRVEAVE